MSKFKFLFTMLAVAVLSLSVAACGGGDSVADESPAEVLSSTFTTDADEQIDSGVVSVALNVDAGSTGNFSFNLSGPFSINRDGGDDSTPDFSLSGALGGTVQGQSMELTAGLTAVNGTGYVTLGDEAYELPADTFDSSSAPIDLDSFGENLPEGGDLVELIRAECRKAAGEAAGGNPDACDRIDANNWVNMTNEGEVELNGEDTVLIKGAFDLPAMLTDLVDIAGEAGGEDAEPPSQAEIDQIADMLTRSDFEVHTGAEDTLLRQAKVTLTVDPTKIPDVGNQPGAPTDPITIELVVTISELNEDQTIEVPANVKPLDQLDPSSIGGGFLGGLLGGGMPSGAGGSDFGSGDDFGDSGFGTDDVPQADSAQVEAYMSCIEAAGDDVNALQQCYANMLDE